MRGMIHIYTGEGKGKTTAAIGLSIRCAGSGSKVVFAQFLKGNQSSEVAVLSSTEGITYLPCEKEFGFLFYLAEEERAEAFIVFQNHLEKAIANAKNENARLLILDEIIPTYREGMIDKDFFLNFLRNKPEELEVVLTGRNPEEVLIQLADYVSEIKMIKHPFTSGVKAREGIEY